MTKHFWKTLIIFAVMILLGLIGVFLVSNLDKDNGLPDNNIKVAK